MKSTQKKKNNNLKPRHRHTKEYLKHYYPFLPLFISFIFFFTALLLPVSTILSSSVKGAETSEIEQSIIEITNSVREKDSLVGLNSNQKLKDAAESKAKDMVRRNYWSHTTPEGSEPWDFIKKNGYSYATAGENLAYGFNNGQNIVNAWLSSPAHRDNILNNEYAEVGIGTATATNFQDGGPAIIVVAMYAKPLNTQTSSVVENGILGVSDKQIALVSSSTGATWARNTMYILTSLGVLYLLISHSVGAKKVLHRGELFVVRHPVLDSLIIITISSGIILLKSSGSIL